jgi:hypothetical protein
MRKALTAMLAIGALVIPVAASAAGKQRHVHFTAQVVGAGVSATQSAYKIHDSHFGNGAGVQTVTTTASGGTDSEITYYGDATARSTGTFTVGTPDANGIAPVTGSGHDVGGTGKAKGLKSTYTYSGTLNTKTGVFEITLTGTYTHLNK